MKESDNSVEGRAAPLDLKLLNDRHIRTSDKFFRMFAGAASQITAFEEECICLDIHVDNRLAMPLEKITRNIAASWHREPELQSAKSYVAHIYKTERPSGFVVSGFSPEMADEIVRRAKELVTEYPDILLTCIRGSFEKPREDFVNRGEPDFTIE